MGKGGIHLPKIAASPFRKEFKKVRQHAEDHGWRVEDTSKGYKFLAPPEAVQPGFKGIVVTHETPSDHRAFKNFLGDLKIEGGLLPPDRCEECNRKPKADQVTDLQHDPTACLQQQGIGTEGLSPEEVDEFHDMSHEGDATKAG